VVSEESSSSGDDVGVVQLQLRVGSIERPDGKKVCCKLKFLYAQRILLSHLV